MLVLCQELLPMLLLEANRTSFLRWHACAMVSVSINFPPLCFVCALWQSIDPWLFCCEAIELMIKELVVYERMEEVMKIMCWVPSLVVIAADVW